MTLRPFVVVTLLGLVLASLYALSVKRGGWGMREELPWEVAASGYLPIRTHMYAEQRMPQYPRPARWLAPVLGDVHAIDVRLRSGYWHERDVPEFDDAPDFVLSE